MNMNPIFSPNTSSSISSASSSLPPSSKSSTSVDTVLAVSPPTTVNASAIQMVNIKTHVPIILGLDDATYRQWRRFFDTVFGKFGLRAHLTTSPIDALPIQSGV
uniref:Uncharacterized protein n=1 Tax=Kalanchoe fedtschenkoi TaxID=63787 RepID=A0A7N0VNC7_KALFE